MLGETFDQYDDGYQFYDSEKVDITGLISTNINIDNNDFLKFLNNPPQKNMEEYFEQIEDTIDEFTKEREKEDIWI